MMLLLHLDRIFILAIVYVRNIIHFCDSLFENDMRKVVIYLYYRMEIVLYQERATPLSSG